MIPLANARGGSRRSLTTATLRGPGGLIEPHGGVLVDLITGTDEAKVKTKCTRVIELSERQACDVELLCNGAFSPLTGFMTEAEYDGTVASMRLPNGTTFALPVVLDTPAARDDVKVGDWVLLTYRGEDLAALEVTDRWVPDRVTEAKNCMGTTSIEHPGVLELTTQRGGIYLGGPVHGFRLPKRDIPCKTPAQVRAELPPGGDVVAFQCRNPIHRAHHALFMTALDAPNVAQEAVVLVHPTVGPTQADDIPGIVRYETYQVLEREVDDERIRWAMLPYSMKMAGPREAIHHMIIRKNFGCTHFIIGRDMAGSKSSLTGDDFYGAFEAQEMAQKMAPTLGMETVASRNLVATLEEDYISAEDAKAKGYEAKKLSGTKFRQMLREGEDIPEWFAFPSVVTVLRKHVQVQRESPAAAK